MCPGILKWTTHIWHHDGRGNEFEWGTLYLNVLGTSAQVLLEGGARPGVVGGADGEEVGVLGGGLGPGCPLEAGLLPEGGEGGQVGELEGPGVGGVLRPEDGGQAGQLLPLQLLALLIG